MPNALFAQEATCELAADVDSLDEDDFDYDFDDDFEDEEDDAIGEDDLAEGDAPSTGGDVDIKIPQEDE